MRCKRADLEELLELVDQQRLHPVIDRVVGLDDVAAAQTAMEDRRIFGKVVVRPQQ